MKGFKQNIGLAAVGLILGAAVFGASVKISDRAEPGTVSVAVPDLQPVFDVMDATLRGATPVAMPSKNARHIVLGGQAQLKASEDHWAFVRQSATWANGNSTFADNLITSLKSSGVLGTTSDIQTTSTLNGVSYKIRLQTNCSGNAVCQNKSSQSYTGTKTYTHRFKMWRASDDKDVLEMLFDDITEPSGDGVLMHYRLGILDTSSATNPDLIVESYISGTGSNRKQVYSWGAAFHTTGSEASTTSDRGRVILEEMTIGLKGGGTASGALCVKVVARTVSTATYCGSAGNHYYTLAYGQRNDDNLQATAKAGFANGGYATTHKPCDLGVLSANLTFGVFNSGGFVSEGDSDSIVPNGSPDPSVNGSYGGVNALYTEIGTSGAGAGTYDDTQKATIDGLSAIVFPNASESPGF